MRVCSVPGCPELYTGTATRCLYHETAAKQQHWARTKGYSTKGHRIRFRIGVLQRDPICVVCQVAQSTEADHYPLGRDELLTQGLDPDDPRHGRGLCSPCHKRETAAHQPGGWNAR